MSQYVEADDFIHGCVALRRTRHYSDPTVEPEPEVSAKTTGMDEFVTYCSTVDPGFREEYKPFAAVVEPGEIAPGLNRDDYRRLSGQQISFQIDENLLRLIHEQLNTTGQHPETLTKDQLLDLIEQNAKMNLPDDW